MARRDIEIERPKPIHHFKGTVSRESLQKLKRAKTHLLQRNPTSSVHFRKNSIASVMKMKKEVISLC